MLLAVLVWGCGEPEPGQGFPQGLDSFGVQMHIHGHSHHNGARRPGSMQWHSHFAAEERLDVLWWTDHSRILDQSDDLRLDAPDPETIEGFSEGAALRLINAPPDTNPKGEPESEGGALLLRATSQADSPDFARFVYALRGPRGRKFADQTFNRPVSSGAVITADLELTGIHDDVQVELVASLSWHHRNKPILHEVRYRLVEASEAGRRELVDARTAVVEIPWTPGRHTLTLELENDADGIRDGTDNSITDFRITVSARRGARATVKLHRIELHSRSPEPDHQLAKIREFAGRYQEEYDHRQHVGIEYGARPDKALHLNAFLPRGVLTGELAVGDDVTRTNPAEFVRRVHALGGIVSYNHMFGTHIAQAKPEGQRVLSRRMVLELLENRAWGCDILEVGYKARGGVGLEGHLRTWDTLTANGLFMYGNAVSDSHGDAWTKGMKPNPYTTWIWAPDPSAAGLLEGIQRGRMNFGDPFRYRGRLYLRVGDAEMGDRTSVGEEKLPLIVSVDEQFDPEKHRLLLVQGLIDRAGLEPTYLTGAGGENGTPIRPGDSILIDVSRPTFVRLEMYDAEGHALIFSNPIVFDDLDRSSSGSG